VDRRRRVLERIVKLALLATLCTLGAAAPVFGQPSSQPRVYVAADSLYQALFDPFAKTSTFDLFHESASLTATYPPAKTPALLGTVAVRLWKVVSVGVVASRVQSRTDATVEGEIPHPFFFDQDRHVEGGAEGITRAELGVHLQFRIVIPVTGRLDLSVFGGPSRWWIRQDRIADVTYTSQYPFDTVRFTGTAIQETTATTWGYNAGIDASVYLTNHVGVGGLLLIATANPDATTTATTADTRIGGLRAGGGLRLRF
jgi:hypothetical protein